MGRPACKTESATGSAPKVRPPTASKIPVFGQLPQRAPINGEASWCNVAPTQIDVIICLFARDNVTFPHHDGQFFDQLCQPGPALWIQRLRSRGRLVSFASGLG